MWEAMYDKLGDLLVLVSLGGFAAVWKRSRDVDRKFNDFQLDLARNYVTKTELKAVEDKLDHLQETMSNKMDTVNTNIMLLLRTPHA